MTEENKNSLGGSLSFNPVAFEGSHTFRAGVGVEMLKISKDGFWVRGVKVEQGPYEAEEVYNVFKSFLGLR